MRRVFLASEIASDRRPLAAPAQRLASARAAEVPTTVIAAQVFLMRDHPHGIETYLQKRAAQLRQHANRWSTIGGKADPPETALEAAIREAHEEAAVKLSAHELVIAGYGQGHSTKGELTFLQMITLFAVNANNHRPIINSPAEAQDEGWFTLRSAIELLHGDGSHPFNSSIEVVQRMLELENLGFTNVAEAVPRLQR
jgi:8-oxo-dGTP pyrophosphatase MutT (NUDIX family)